MSPAAGGNVVVGLSSTGMTADRIVDAERSRWLVMCVPCVYNVDVMTPDGIGSVAGSHALLKWLISMRLNPIVISDRLHSGGGHDLDDTTQIHEFSVPHVDLARADETLTASAWSHGIVTGVGNPGYTYLNLTTTEATVEFRDATGGVRYKYVIPARVRGR